jgi:hypothetical protein
LDALGGRQSPQRHRNLARLLAGDAVLISNSFDLPIAYTVQTKTSMSLLPC